MGVESGTYVNDFDTSAPGSTDLRSQGDDHLRLIKTFLKNTFVRATREWSIPGTLSKTADYTVVKADQEHTIYVSTAGANCTMTLPTLVAGDAGWKVHFIKTNSGANPMFIAPPSGTINSGGISGLAKCRRAIPGVRITAIWDGTGFFVTRAHATPIGCCIEYHGASLPAGFEWPNGQTLASASTNYPEYNSALGSGVTLDKRGRIGIALDNLGGSSAGRLAGGIITGTAIGNTGGTDTVTLTTGQIPSHTHANTLTDPGHSHTVYRNSGFVANIGAAGGSPPNYGSDQASTTNATGITISNAAAGSGGSHSNLQPSIMVSEVLVVE